jgi:hypothetical protein
MSIVKFNKAKKMQFASYERETVNGLFMLHVVHTICRFVHAPELDGNGTASDQQKAPCVLYGTNKARYGTTVG